MAVVDVRPVSSGRTGGESNTLKTTYKRVFEVEVNSLLDGPEIVLAPHGLVDVPELPQQNDIYEPESGVSDEGAICYEITATVKPNSYLWEVVALYSTYLERPDIEGVSDPLLRPSEIEYDSITVSVPLLYDIYGNPILNSAGDLFDPPLEQDETRGIMRVTRNFADFDPLFYWGFKNTVNSTEWLGLKKYQVKCKNIRATRFFEVGQYWYRVTAEFEIGMRTQEDGTIPPDLVWPEGSEIEEDDTTSLTWIRIVLDRGFREIKQSPPDPPTLDGVLAPILDPMTKQAITIPGLLDGDGYHLLPGEDPVWLAFDVLPDKDFNLLNLFVGGE